MPSRQKSSLQERRCSQLRNKRSAGRTADVDEQRPGQTERHGPGLRCVLNVRVAPQAGLAGPNRATKIDARCDGVPRVCPAQTHCQHECSPGHTGSGVRTCCRNAASDRASRRDTCICEMPSRPAIWVCVMFSKNRSLRTVCSRSGNAARSGRTVSMSSTFSRLVSISPKVWVIDRPSSSSSLLRPGRQKTGWCKRWMQSAPAPLLLGRCLSGWQSRWLSAHAPTAETMPRALLELQIELFEPAGNPDRPSVIPEVSANFAHHGRHGEGQEFRAVVGIEPAHRVESARPAPPGRGLRAVRRGHGSDGRCGWPAAGSVR